MGEGETWQQNIIYLCLCIWNLMTCQKKHFLTLITRHLTDCGWIQYTNISSFYIRNSNTTRYYNIVCKRKFTKEWNRKRNTTELILQLTSSSCVGTRHAISFSTICFSFNHCRKESKNESNLGQISFSEKICKLSYVWCTIKSILQDLIKMSLSNLNEWTWKLDLS